MNVAGIPIVMDSMPRLVGEQAILETVPLPLNEEESIRLCSSAGIMADVLDERGGG
jgi:hypothetical protein